MAGALNEDDAVEIATELLDVQNQSKLLGRVLKLNRATVNSICVQFSNPEERLLHIIDEFVKQVDPRPTWRVIVEALRNPLINNPALAQELEKKYCSFSFEQDGMHFN